MGEVSHQSRTYVPQFGKGSNSQKKNGRPPETRSARRRRSARVRRIRRVSHAAESPREETLPAQHWRLVFNHGALGGLSGNDFRAVANGSLTCVWQAAFVAPDIFSPARLGPITLRNRIIKAAT